MQQTKVLFSFFLLFVLVAVMSGCEQGSGTDASGGVTPISSEVKVPNSNVSSIETPEFSMANSSTESPGTNQSSASSELDLDAQAGFDPYNVNYNADNPEVPANTSGQTVPVASKFTEDIADEGDFFKNKKGSQFEQVAGGFDKPVDNDEQAGYDPYTTDPKQDNPYIPSNTAAIWPDKTDKKAWPVDKNITKAQADNIISDYTSKVIQDLEAKNNGKPISMEQLMGALTEKFPEKTPYETTSKNVKNAMGAIGVGLSGKENDYTRIFQRGYGLCGDYSLLMNQMVKSALNHEGLEHLQKDKDRVQEITVVGDSIFGPVGRATHAANGLVTKQAFENKVIKTNPRTGKTWTSYLDLDQHDVVVYDLYNRPVVTGDKTLGTWAIESLGGKKFIVTGVSNIKGEYTVNFGYKTWKDKYGFWGKDKNKTIVK